MLTSFYGRVIEITKNQLTLRSERGIQTVSCPPQHLTSSPIRIGDLISVKEGVPQLLTQNRSQSSQWMNRILDPRRIHGTQIRARVESGIREYFSSLGFHETRTPLLVPCPGMEPHIRPYLAQTYTPDAPLRFLPTSPEFAMKRLLVGGLEKIFQICSSFRDEPHSPHHRPEFTMLEWYRAYSNYEQIMHDTEHLIESLAMRIHGKPSIPFQGREISVKAPWPRLPIRSLYQEQVGVDLVRCSQREDLAQECKRLGLPVNSEDHWDDLYFKIWLNLIEPNLPSDQAVFVTRYPASQAALAVIDQDPDGSRWAKRFELYAGGMELGNAFEELTDPAEQRKRFIWDMNLREEIYGPSFPKSPLDEEFLAALEEGMPPSGGIAVGVDRLIMLLANETDIEFTRWL